MYICIYVGYTLIAVVSYIRRLLVYIHTYPLAPEATWASGTDSGEVIYNKYPLGKLYIIPLGPGCHLGLSDGHWGSYEYIYIYI